jgi:Domain of unknown function DUF29
MRHQRKPAAMSAIASVPPDTTSSPYETDYYSWAIGQARALREHRNQDLDWENLAEEVEDLANRNADALESQGERLIGHLLKIAVAPARIKDQNLRLWRLSIRDARRRIRTLLKRNPGLKVRTAELFIEAWPGGRDHALAATGKPDEAIPEACLWTFDQAMDDGFEPRGIGKP